MLKSNNVCVIINGYVINNTNWAKSISILDSKAFNYSELMLA